AFDYHANKQNEILRLTNVHVTNLENIIKAKDAEICELNKAIDYYRKKESIIWKILSKLKNATKNILKPEKAFTKIVKYIYRTIRHPFKMLKTYLTSAGRNRIVGDFLIGDAYFESGKVNFPLCEYPKVSIIIPCYNQIRYTYKCLYSIMKNTNPEETPYEVILADDNSTDTTKNIKKFVDNIVVSRNEENLGFLKNCNKAASLAKGEYIYFLNNDTEVKENYLSSLTRLLDENHSIGMTGSKLVYADGTLQEAGGIIYNDGTGANYGRNQNPKDFKFNYVKDVDYISGASIMIRKSLWLEIGGFDERFCPAYCEDSDLAFEVRRRGFRVVYQPKSEVIHYEGKSCGTDENDTNSIKSYQVENNKKLKEKWETELLLQSPIKDVYHARERSQDKKIVLFIDHYVPTWDKDAGSKTTFAYIKMFIKRGYQVKFLGDNFALNEPYGEVLQQLGVEVLYGAEIQAGIWDYLKENRRNIEYIYLNRPHIAVKYIDFIRENMKAKVIFYGHDLHYLRLKREFDTTGDDNALFESKYYRALEYSLIYKSDMSYYPSHIEIDEI
ncbi:MAG: glycosyltransferase family 2 protein, partial [Lachnospiraceae bacterium]|nr:glycosyltransferase family 2 protein [Lachnospiraceae bacterium]